MEVPRTFVNSHFLHVQNRGWVAYLKSYLEQLPNRSESFKSLSTGAEKYIRTSVLPLYYMGVRQSYECFDTHSLIQLSTYAAKYGTGPPEAHNSESE